MFNNKKFVFIGKFKKKSIFLNNQKLTKKHLMNKIKQRGGKEVTSISSKTDFVIFPLQITNRERTNQQIKNLPKIYNRRINFLHYNWILDCIDKSEILSMDKYKVKEFYSKTRKTKRKYELNMTSFNEFGDYKPEFYENFLSKNTKCWAEYVDKDGKIFYYCVLTDVSIRTPPSNYIERIFGGISITEDKFYTEKGVLIKRKDFKKSINDLEKCLIILKNYKKTVKLKIKESKSNRKRKRWNELKNLTVRLNKRRKLI